MSVKGMMQTVLVTELKQIQPDISNEALQYVVDNFSQMFDVREILAEENQELFQSNKNLNMAFQKVSDYNLRLEHQLSDERMKSMRLENERDTLTIQLTDAFGDGYYDGFLDGAKHHEKTNCNTDSTYLGEDALRCSEIAEQAKSKRMGIPSRLDMLAERDALAATIGHINYLIERVYNSYKNNTGYEPSLSVFHRDLDEAYRFLDKTPQQCLAEIRAEAGWAGFVEGINYLDKVWCKDATSDVVVAADEYAAKVRQGGGE